MWKRFRIRGRLLFGFGLLMFFMVLAGGYAILQMNSLADQTTKLYNSPMTVSNSLRQVKIHIIKMHRSMKDVTLARDESQIDSAVNEVKNNDDNISKLITLVHERFLGKEGVDELGLPDVILLGKTITDWKVIRDEVIDLTRKGMKAAANSALQADALRQAADITKGKGAKYVIRLEAQLDKFINFANKKAKKFKEDSEKERDKTIIITIIIVFLALVLSFFITGSITNSIVHPLNKAVDVAEHLARGDIAVSIQNDTPDETGELLRAMNNMVEKLRYQLKEMSVAATVLSGSASQISTTTTQFAASFVEIASSINETVSSLKEVRQTSELSNKKAKNVSDSSKNVVQVSQKGENAVNSTVTAMSGIQEQMLSIAESIVSLSERNQSIGDIIGVVDDISEQSRLLAVNASIEAVKAGEHGKGFSVVAAEIKNLALQSKQSTNQVRSILKEIQKATGKSVMVTEKGNKTVENGVILAQQTGEAIRFLGENVEESSKAAVQIEVTSRQQLAGIEQVFAAMENINTAISQNSKGAKQLETASRNLEELARKMKSIVDNYRL
ncbi:MAG: methyl-accepting chemotaxis protein [bacterium]|nr:methyl-accepting chemotaxis protein [bacterium]